jgi:translation elongation factor EF-Tu-like GTPase
VTRDEFNARLKQTGGLRLRVRLRDATEGGRSTPISGDREYRANWSLGKADPDAQVGAPILIDEEILSPGDDAEASLIPLFPETWPTTISPGTRLIAFEGRREVAEAVVTEVIAAQPQT